MKIYIVSGAGPKLYFSSLKKAAKFIVDKYVKILTVHNEPNYFYSNWPSPNSWIDAGMYKIFEVSLNIDESAKEVDKEIIKNIIDKYSKEI